MPDLAHAICVESMWLQRHHCGGTFNGHFHKHICLTNCSELKTLRWLGLVLPFISVSCTQSEKLLVKICHVKDGRFVRFVISCACEPRVTRRQKTLCLD